MPLVTSLGHPALWQQRPLDETRAPLLVVELVVESSSTQWRILHLLGDENVRNGKNRESQQLLYIALPQSTIAYMTKRPEGSVNEARRRLAKVGLYAVPAILTVVAVRSAGAMQVSDPMDTTTGTTTTM